MFDIGALGIDGDVYQRRELMFPQLTHEMVDRSLAYGKVETHPAGATIHARGRRNVDFMIVLRGSVLIVASGDRGAESIVTIHGEREFTGELDLFSRRESLVAARAATDVEILRINNERFRDYVASEADIADIVMRAVILRRVGLIQHLQSAVTILGSGRNTDTLELESFLSRNGHPYRVMDTDTEPDVESLLNAFGVNREDLPVVIAETNVYRNPTVPELADALGIAEELNPDHVYDVAIVGAGPAGLATAVYAASEGLDTIMVEGRAPGGQAGTSSRIENYLGFPSGISGLELAARAQTQAQKFGAKLAISRNATGIECDDNPLRIRLMGDLTVMARAVVIATGARYRKLSVSNLAKYEMHGIHYSATAIEARLCINEEVVVVGGGNSAGQAAVFLSAYAKHVHMLIRRDELAATMSEYLVHRIAGNRRISLHPNTEITALRGDRHIEGVTWKNRLTDELREISVHHLFVMIGADPCTQWLNNCIQLDRSGFVITGTHEQSTRLGLYQTSRPGIFAVGDVRSGSVKRVASSVGEGAVVVADIHNYLKDLAAGKPF